MHEFNKLFDYSLKECPVRDKEIRELTDNIHNISGNLSFAALSLSVLAKVKKLFDNTDDKFVFIISAHATRD